MIWLQTILSKLSLTEDHKGYLLGRGAKEESILDLGCVTWRAREQVFDDPIFAEQYGGKGEYLQDWLIVPLWSPRGHLIGFEGRRTDVKKITRYLLPTAAWNPIWVGLSSSGMQRLWEGGDLWVVEGVFDVFPLQWAIPSTDVALGSVRAKLTQKHVTFIQRFCQTGVVHMVYDNDETGQRGTHGWIDDTGKKRWGATQQLENVGVRCTVVPFSGGKDPGEIWDRFGVDGLKKTFTA